MNNFIGLLDREESLCRRSVKKMGVEEQQSEEIDPLSDPEERCVLYGALDSFRYACQPLFRLITRQIVDIIQAVSPCSAL